MNARTTPANSPPPNTGTPRDFQNLCSFAMDHALGIEKASLATVVSLNSSVLDIYKSSLWFTPVLGNLLDMVSQAVACSMEMQMNWFTLMAPLASPHVAAAASAVAHSSGSQAQPNADEFAYSMDIAIGAEFTAPAGAVTSISGGKARPKAEVLERSMDIAIGARAA